MATAAVDFDQALFSDMKNNATIVGLLGPVAATNFRFYAEWPQQQPELTGYEPAEGWIVFLDNSQAPFPHQLYEDHMVDVNIYSTRPSIATSCMAELDGMWNRAADQDGFSITGDWVVVFSQRIRMLRLYEDARKLYRRLLTYQFRTTKTPWRRGA